MNDEEQQSKLDECLQLLVAAGYHRARIQGLPPFDKLVGGIAWCIETCSIDLDIDLFYNDSLTIGQKISLTERLVDVLPLLKCPHHIQPHQIQGLDSASILPVMQWLVAEALTQREQYGSLSKAVAVSYYSDNYTSQTSEQEKRRANALTAMGNELLYKRRWCVSNAEKREKLSPQQKVTTTLLEYCPNLSDSKSSLSTKEEMNTDHLSKLSSSTRMSQLLTHAASNLPLNEKTSAYSLEQQVASLQSVTSGLEERLHEAVEQKENMKRNLLTIVEEVKERKNLLTQKKTENNIGKSSNLEEIRLLVEKVEEIKQTEQKFKDECRQHADDLNKQIGDLEERISSSTASDSVDELQSILSSEKERYSRVRDVAAESAHQVAVLRRRWDDVPGRAELSQYRHRLTELSDQVVASERETLQFQTLLKTLLNCKAFMDTHLLMLNDILDNIPGSIKTVGGTEDLFNQVNATLDRVKNSEAKVNAEKATEEALHLQVSSELTNLQDKARVYARTAHSLANQLNKNHQLLEMLGEA